jgi:hypothetical protein
MIVLMNSTRPFVAVIGERMCRIEAPNVWQAGMRAAVWFVENLREGEDFFAGREERVPGPSKKLPDLARDRSRAL